MKTNNRLIFNSKAVILITILVIALTSFLVFFIGHKSIFVELQITLGIIALLLFIFLFVGLYFGVYFKEETLVDIGSIKIDKDSSYGLDVFNFGDLLKIDFDDGFVGLILGVVVSFFLLVFLVVFANIFLSVGLVLLGILEYIFLNAYKQVFNKVSVCRGHLINSLTVSLSHTFYYISWIFALIWISKLFIHHV